MNLQIEKNHPVVTTLRMEVTGARWEQWFLLRSDAHHDNLHCNQEMERRHLEEAKARNAGILDFGDLFCAMQGKWDKRADQTQMREELRGSDYLDRLVSYCADFYRPYAANWILLAQGNHESAIQRRNETSLGERLAERLRVAGSPVVTGTYRGWIWFQFRIKGTQRHSLTLHYTHGYGGGGPVTRDVIQTARQMVYLDADFMVSGHSHDSWNLPIRRERLNHAGKPVLNDVEHVKCGGYKDEFSPGTGWANEKGFPPKPLGAYWLRFYCKPSQTRYAILHDLVRAH